ncbi:MAG: phosphatase PAP2 family protein [bacterium]|nr:phosphatase PAP2 family protein [bacterium]
MNQALFSYLYGFAHRSAALDSAIVFFATDFGLIVGAAFLYFLYTHEDKRRAVKELLIVAGTAFVAWVLAHVIKYFYPAGRPDTLIDAVKPLFAHGSGIDAFPSGHATFFAALSMAAFFYHKKVGYLLAAVALLVGLARVMAGVHSPFDVIAGFALGIFVALTLHFFVRRR